MTLPNHDILIKLLYQIILLLPTLLPITKAIFILTCRTNNCKFMALKTGFTIY